MKSLTLVVSCILISVIFVHNARGIDWNGNNWALDCNFPGNDFIDFKIPAEQCGEKCANTADCTHFTWNDGTCWLKKGDITKDNATIASGAICGMIYADNISPKSKRSQLSSGVLRGVLATRHGAKEPGACALPTANYAIVHPVALGSMDSLKGLKFRPELCGQVLKVNCGNGPLNIIVTNSNYGRGLDLYGSTWDKLTNHKPPGETSCSVKLTSLNAFNFKGPRCYYKPGTDFVNPYYHNVGLLNTKGRRVIKATIDNRPGQHRGDNPYYAFDFGPLDKNKKVIFTLDNGRRHTVFLRDCKYKKSEQIWQ